MAEVTVAMMEVTLSRVVEVAMVMAEVDHHRATGCYSNRFHLRYRLGLY
jgi:hypothetical protein